MINTLLDAFLDALIDSVKIIPFLFITYLIIEYLEHKASNKTEEIIKKADKLGPFFGGILGIVPQCGFSTAASNFYAGRIISLGTLIAIYLSTSDEMLPILISESISITVILKILFIKMSIGIIIGFLIDFLLRKRVEVQSINSNIGTICEHEHCHCNEEGIIVSAIKHSLQIFFFIFLVSLALNIIITYIGEDNLSAIILNKPVIGELLAGLVGLIPNCAASVAITELYLSNAMSAGAMISGLLVSAGVGLLVLFRVNKNLKENIKIVALLYSSGVIIGILLNFFNFSL